MSAGQIDAGGGIAAPNSENSPSSAPANGPASAPANFLHVNPYPYTAAPGQPHVCAAGNEKYIPKKVVVGNPPLLQNTTRGSG